jgi:hypothetical protein
MIDFEEMMNIANENWLMSTREKLSLIGLLQCMKPKLVVEFGYHRGGATKWLAEFAEKVISVDVNEFVSEASAKYPNVEPWNCSTAEAIHRIENQSLSFDLALIDADHSRSAVLNDIQGILPYANVILMHDSFNPQCRKGMISALKSQNSHAYYLDFIPSILKADGLWGGLAIAWKSQKRGSVNEFTGEKSSFPAVFRQSIFHSRSKIIHLNHWLTKFRQSTISKLSILCGKLLGR